MSRLTINHFKDKNLTRIDASFYAFKAFSLGKSKIVIKDGKVVKVEEPQINYCPLFHKYRNIEKLNPQVVKDNIKFRIKDFGMCTSQRELKMRDL